MSAPDRWRALDALAEPRRRAVFEHVRASGGPQTRDEVAAALGMTRALAAFHLDRLAADGLLTVDYARPPDRRGPGAGRPAKRYRTVAEEIALSVPERHYDLMARVLARGIAAASPQDPATAARDAAYDEGRRAGESARETPGGVVPVLGDLGYEPYTDDGVVRLANCPFHRVVAESPALVCGVNLGYLQGVLDGLGVLDSVAELDPGESRCCVAVVPGALISRSAAGPPSRRT